MVGLKAYVLSSAPSTPGQLLRNGVVILLCTFIEMLPWAVQEEKRPFWTPSYLKYHSTCNSCHVHRSISVPHTFTNQHPCHCLCIYITYTHRASLLVRWKCKSQMYQKVESRESCPTKVPQEMPLEETDGSCKHKGSV